MARLGVATAECEWRTIFFVATSLCLCCGFGWWFLAGHLRCWCGRCGWLGRRRWYLDGHLRMGNSGLTSLRGFLDRQLSCRRVGLGPFGRLLDGHLRLGSFWLGRLRRLLDGHL